MAALHTQAFGEKIKDIAVVGNKRIESSTVKSYLGAKVGQEFDEHKIIASLYATDLFEDIKLRCVNGKLTVTVQEMPFIEEIKFVGNSKVK